MVETNTNYYKFPYEVNSVYSATNEMLLKDFRGERTGFVQVGEKKYFFPQKFEQEAAKYYNIEVRPDDVWIVTFPRSGTTLTQELVWLIGNNLDYNTAAKYLLDQRSPFLEFGMFFHEDVKEELLKENSHSDINKKLINHISKHGWEILPNMKSPRFIKTHLPFSLLPKGWHLHRCKTIYVARNPMDVVVSFYHLNKLFRTQGFQGDLEQYWKYFEQNLQPWTPYWSHIEEAWQRRHHSNIVFLFYENITKDMYNSIKQIASFLDKSLTENQIHQLEEHLSFKNFKENDSVNATFLNDLKITKRLDQGFIRKGKINHIDDEVTPDLRHHIEKWINKNMTELNIEFPKIV